RRAPGGAQALGQRLERLRRALALGLGLLEELALPFGLRARCAAVGRRRRALRQLLLFAVKLPLEARQPIAALIDRAAPDGGPLPRRDRARRLRARREQVDQHLLIPIGELDEAADVAEPLERGGEPRERVVLALHRRRQLRAPERIPRRAHRALGALERR